jgi:hypothetical protein
VPYSASIHSPAEPEAAAAYTRLWEASPQRTPFGHLAFGESVAEAFGLSCRIVAAAESGGAWRGATLVFEKGAGPARVAAIPPLGVYVSPVFDAPLDAAEVHARESPLDALADSLGRYAQATFVLPPTHSDARPLVWAGWRLATRYTYVSSLPSGADPMTWSANARRVARKHDNEYDLAEGPEHAIVAARMMRESIGRHGKRFGVSDRAAERVARAVTEAGLARTFVVRSRGGEPEAALVAAHDQSTAYYWIAGGNPGPAMTALLAGALPALAEAGITTFDWCGANTPPVAEFKRRFGAELAPVIRARHVGSRWLRALQMLRGAE